MFGPRQPYPAIQDSSILMSLLDDIRKRLIRIETKLSATMVVLDIDPATGKDLSGNRHNNEEE